MEDRIAIAGAGQWGTALAACLAAAGRNVIVWGRNAAPLQQMAQTRAHPDLPGFRAQDRIEFTADAAQLGKADPLILAVPAQTIRDVSETLAQAGARPRTVILAAKGIEQRTGLTMDALGQDLWPEADVAILSGPTFATELARGLPGAATLACHDLERAEAIAALFAGGSLRLYASADPPGVALGGATKNVLAIAAGAVMGADLGANARAAVIARGLAEMTRLGVALGARAETLAGLSGLGDVVLSCTDAQSRNYRLGLALGQGEPPPDVLTEGAHTAAPLLELANSNGVEMPIAAAVDAVLNRGTPITHAVAALLARPGQRE